MQPKYRPRPLAPAWVPPDPIALRDLLTLLQQSGVTALVLTNDGVTTDIPIARVAAWHLSAKAPVIRVEMRARSLDTLVLGRDADRVLGISRNGYEPQTDAGKERDRLMAALGWPAETLTLEQLRERMNDATR